MAAASGHELGGGTGKDPVVSIEVRHVQVQRLSDQRTGEDASPGVTQRAGFAMTFV